MARCKDCYHYDVCMDYTELKNSEFAQNFDQAHIGCEHFVAKSEVRLKSDISRIVKKVASEIESNDKIDAMTAIYSVYDEIL